MTSLRFGFGLTILLASFTAHAVSREVTLQNTSLADLPGGSVSLTGGGISNVQVERQEDGDNVTLTFTYDDSDTDHRATLLLPRGVAPSTEINLPNSLAPVFIDPRSGLVRRNMPSNSDVPRFEVWTNYSLGEIGLPSVRSPAVEVTPNEGASPSDSADEVDLDGVEIGMRYAINDRFAIDFSISNFDGDEASGAVLEAGTGRTWGWLFPELFMGSTGVLVGDFSSTIINDVEVDGQQYRIGFGFPCDEEWHGWEIEPRIELGYRNRDFEFTQSMVFADPLSGLSASQNIDLDERTLSLSLGSAARYPLTDRFSFVASLYAIAERVDVDGNVVLINDLFGDVTTIVSTDDTSDTGFAALVGVGLEYDADPFLVALEYARVFGSTTAEANGTTNGDNILAGERFRVSSSSEDSQAITVSFRLRF